MTNEVFPRALREIADEMEALASESDWEDSHLRADDLLIEAIERLSPYATETADEGVSERVIEAFHRLEKWYA